MVQEQAPAVALAAVEIARQHPGRIALGTAGRPDQFFHQTSVLEAQDQGWEMFRSFARNRAN